MFRSVVCTIALLGLLPAAAQAVTPRPKAMVEDDRHNSGGNDWHVQLEANNRSTRLATVVLFSQKCKQTGYLQSAALSADGAFDLVDVPFQKGTGVWSVQGSFIDPDRASGTWSMNTGTCTDSGTFVAQDSEGHFLIGNPYEYAPKRVNGTSLNARRVRRLKYLTRLNVRRFDTVAEATRKGYEMSTDGACPGMVHARKRGTVMWGKLLDPTAPQSLIFWCNSNNEYTLAAFMYRADPDSRPTTFGDIIQWHRHGRDATWMTHVWLVPDPTAALATCAPFRAFEGVGAFSYEPFAIDARIDTPCSDSVPAEPSPAQSEMSPAQ